MFVTLVIFVLTLSGLSALKCTCTGKEIVCEASIPDGVYIEVPECPDADRLRSMGPGVVVGVRTPVRTPVEKVALHRTTLECNAARDLFIAKEVTLNQKRCFTTASTTTTTRSIKLPTPPGRRPPVVPVNDNRPDDDNRPDNEDNRPDDDDNRPDDDNNDDDHETSSVGNTTTSSTSTTQTQPIIVIRGHVTLRGGLVIAFTILIGGGTVVILVRLHMRRRRRRRMNQPVQLQEISSTTAESLVPPRSPRRRRTSMTSLESVVLYPVSEHQD